MKYNIVVIDGNNLIFRAFYAHQDQIAGVVSMIQGIKRRWDASTYICVFDKPKSNLFRRYLSNVYKDGRHKDFDIAEAIQLVVPAIKRIGVHTWEAPAHYEADDVIGTIAISKGTPDLPSLVVSSDKDFLQLVHPTVQVCLLKNGGLDKAVIHTHSNFYEFVGVYPRQYLAYKVLIGDKSDNVQGVYRIGHSTAVKLLNKYHTLENVLLSDEFKKYLQDEELSTVFNRLVVNESIMRIRLMVPLSTITIL